MKVRRLKMINYRCFREIEIDLHDRFTLLVGNNGSGKTTVLDGLAVGLGSFFLGMDGDVSKGIHKNDVHFEIFEIGSRLEKQAQYPASIVCVGEIEGEAIEWSRSLNTKTGKTTYGEANALSSLAKQMSERVSKGDTAVILPILSYYRTGRLWAKKKERQVTTQVNLTSRNAGYADCLDAMSNDKLMYKWFAQMTYQELQEGVSVPELATVKKAILACFNGSGNVEMMGIAKKCIYNVKTEEIEITYVHDGKKEIQSLEEMSDGYRNMLSMVADIAYRMALLNPQLLDRVTEDTSGVVLIDEIDLHLHPSWQRHIVSDLKRIFPKVQFIATTHAPSVIASVPQEEIIVLENHEAMKTSHLTYGRDANAILRTIMDVPERPDDVDQKLKRFHVVLDKGELQEARQLLQDITDILGNDDATVIGARTALELEAME